MPTQQTFASHHIQYMKEALQLAQQGQYTCAPNPMVGAVITQNNIIIGKGFHQRAGEPHAEVNAIQDALTRVDSLENADLYVTLEPCSHHGRTPPCCDSIRQHRFGNIYIACQDPNPLVGGQGIQQLQENYKVHTGLLAQEALELNHTFFHRMRTGKPWVQVKMAASLDGRTALHNGKSQWITGPAARADVHRLRLAASAIITGRRTFIEDQARLNAREDMLGFTPERQPLRIILDQTLQTLQTLQDQAPFQPTLLVTSKPCLQQGIQTATTMNNLECIDIIQKNGLLHIETLLTTLAQRQINSLFVEAGPTLAGYCLEHHLVDELILYMAPTMLGADSKAMFDIPILQDIPSPNPWRFQSTTLIGNQESQQDLKITLRRT